MFSLHRIKALCSLALVTVFSPFLSSASAADDTAAWWNKDWGARRKITVETNGIGLQGQPVSAPLLIRLHDANFGFAAKEDGSDLRVCAADGKTEVKFHLEKYDAFLSNQAYLWVLPDSIGKDAKTDLYLYYSNLKPEVVAESDAKAMHDSNVVLNYHFAESGTPIDSSATGANSTTPATFIEGSLIGGGIKLDAASSITTPENPALLFPANSEMTWSAWAKMTAPAAGAIMSYGPANTGVVLALDAAGIPSLSVANTKTPSATPLAANAWTHLAVVASAGKITLYVDGKLATTAASGIPALEKPIFTLGKNESAPGFIGEMDEMAVANVARADSWLRFAATTQGTSGQDKFLGFAAEELVQMSWLDGSSTSAVLVRSLTVDGWVVIVICAFMAVGSWWIMWSKMRLLGRINKGNKDFMERWKKLSRDLTALDGSDADSIKSMGGLVKGTELKNIRQSSVYRLYHIGADELSQRLVADGGKDAGVSARSMEAIKATMDSGLVREGQRLNSLIVLLTICISGGPFLGLLGTVIGVMITFAAIAAAGDVNVNSIAPGIAGALLATVAGLAVAIPALFGYNYILTKVKEAMADMSVFIDEFVTRMAENYPDAKGRH